MKPRRPTISTVYIYIYLFILHGKVKNLLERMEVEIISTVNFQINWGSSTERNAAISLVSTCELGCVMVGCVA